MAARLLEDLQARGLTVSLDGAHLRVAPAARLTPELREVILAHKAELMAALRQAAAEAALEEEERGRRESLPRCPHCQASLDRKARCWRCCDRLCSRCGRV